LLLVIIFFFIFKKFVIFPSGVCRPKRASLQPQERWSANHEWVYRPQARGVAASRAGQSQHHVSAARGLQSHLARGRPRLASLRVRCLQPRGCSRTKTRADLGKRVCSLTMPPPNSKITHSPQ